MKVLQIMPCNIEMYATYEVDATDDDGDVSKVNLDDPVVGFALCDNGSIYPMTFREDGVDIEDGSTSNFIKFEVMGHSNYYMLQIVSALYSIAGKDR